MRWFITAALVAASSLAAADPAKPPDVRQMHADDCARARAAHQQCVLDMAGEDVHGTSPKSDGIARSLITFGTNNSLIHIRRELIEQILKTAEDL